jgi:putative FmdB family regulatory protein
LGINGTCLGIGTIIFMAGKMIIYNFRCNKCNSEFEFELTKSLAIIEELGYDVEPSCPNCKSKKVTKLITPPSIRFIGTGFTKSVEEEND